MNIDFFLSRWSCLTFFKEKKVSTSDGGSRWDVSGWRHEGKQRHQSWITGRNLSWHHSASTLPQRIKHIFGPLQNVHLLHLQKQPRIFYFFLQPLAFILVGINAPLFFLITSVHSGVKVGKWPSVTTLFRENWTFSNVWKWWSFRIRK